MNTIKSCFNLIFGILLLILTAFNILIYRCEYVFQPVSYILFLIVYIVVTLIVTIFSVKNKSHSLTASKILGILMPVISLAFVVSLGFAFELGIIYIPQNGLYLETIFAISLISSLIVFFCYASRKWMKTVMAILTGIAAIPFAFVLFITIAFSDFGKTEVTDKSFSPDKTYSAFVITSDQGALGGDTCLYVRNMKRDINIGVGTFKSTEKLLRYGKWSEKYEITWKDNNTLVVGGMEYNIPYILKTDYVDNYKYSVKMKIYIPNRKPDLFEDTHGGFVGDGDCVGKYILTESEINTAQTDVKNNGNWKQIDEESFKYLYGEVPGYYTNGFTLAKIPKVDKGYYCFYDKQTNSFDYPNVDRASSNYIIVVFSSDDNLMYIYELDT